jgi:hypothetical protein
LRLTKQSKNGLRAKVAGPARKNVMVRFLVIAAFDQAVRASSRPKFRLRPRWGQQEKSLSFVNKNTT